MDAIIRRARLVESVQPWNAYCYVGTRVETHEREEAQAELRAVADSTSDLIWSVDPVKFGLLWFNRGQFNSFHDTGNNPAIPYMLVFETKK